jgi:hypothetical protein
VSPRTFVANRTLLLFDVGYMSITGPDWLSQIIGRITPSQAPKDLRRARKEWSLALALIALPRAGSTEQRLHQSHVLQFVKDPRH